MILESVTVDEVVALLNEALALDPDAISALVSRRVPCNEALAAHPTIQTSTREGVGLLGIVNGPFGADAQKRGAIGATVDQRTGAVLGFSRARWEP